MHDVFGQDDRDAMAKKLNEAGIAYGRLNSVDDLINHPQTQYITTMTSQGEVKMIAPGAMFDGKPMVADRIPDLGEHSDAIRAEFSEK